MWISVATVPGSGSFRAEPGDDCRLGLSRPNIDGPDLDATAHHLGQPLVWIDTVADERNVQHPVPVTNRMGRFVE